jgi:hypothetical protein
MTSMLDAVGQSVNRLRNDTPLVDGEDTTFLVIIVSDGAENNSREYTWDTVRDVMTKCKEDKKWTITYMGANQDLSVIQQSLNIPMGNMMLYNNTQTGTAAAYTIQNTGLSNYRSARSTMTADALAVSGVVATFYSSVGGSATETIS